MSRAALRGIGAALKQRGLVADVSSPALGSVLADLLDAPRGPGAPPVSLYAGFDPTGPSLHLGHLAIMVTLARFQQCGIRPIALVSVKKLPLRRHTRLQ